MTTTCITFTETTRIWRQHDVTAADQLYSIIVSVPCYAIGRIRVRLGVDAQYVVLASAVSVQSEEPGTRTAAIGRHK
jgi:hypothetical protein